MRAGTRYPAAIPTRRGSHIRAAIVTKFMPSLLSEPDRSTDPGEDSQDLDYQEPDQDPHHEGQNSAEVLDLQAQPHARQEPQNAHCHEPASFHLAFHSPLLFRGSRVESRGSSPRPHTLYP